MGFGDFAGGFAEAFASAKQRKEDNRIRDEYAKAQAKALEAKLKMQDRMVGAQDRISELMTGRLTSGFDQMPVSGAGDLIAQNPEAFASGEMSLPTPQFDFGPEGELSEITKLQQPMGLAEMIAERPDLLMEAGYLDMGDLINQQTAAIINAREGGAALPNFADMVSQMQGLVDTGVVGTGPDNVYLPPEIRIDEEGKPSAVMRFNPNRQTAQQAETETVGVVNRYNDSIKAIELMNNLENTALQPGSPMNEWLAKGKAGVEGFKAWFGFAPNEETKKQIADFELLEKLFSQMQLTGPENKILTEQGGTLTNEKLRQVQAASAGVDKQSVANAGVLLMQLDLKLEAAEMMGNAPENADEIREYIRVTQEHIKSTGRLPGYEPAAQADPFGGLTRDFEMTVDRVAQMSEKQIDEMIADLDKGVAYSQEVLEAAKKRYLELRRGN